MLKYARNLQNARNSRKTSKFQKMVENLENARNSRKTQKFQKMK